MKNIWRLYRPFRMVIVVISTLMLVLQGTSLLIPKYMGLLVDGLSHDSSTDVLIRIAVTLIAVRIFDSLLSFGLSFININYIDEAVERHLRNSSLKAVFRLSIGQVINENSGFRQSVVSKGENAIKSIVELILTEILPALTRAIVTVVALFGVSRLICLQVLVACVLYFAVSFLMNSKLQKHLKVMRRLDSELDKVYSEIMRNMRLVMVNGQEERTAREYDERYASYQKRHRQIWTMYNIKALVLREPIMYVSYFVVLMVCIRLSKSGAYTPGDIVKIVTWVQMLWATLSRIGPFQRRLTRWHVEAGRYFEMTGLTPAVVTAPDSIRPEKIRGDIEFRNVSFAYPNTKSLDSVEDGKKANEHLCAVENVSFKINAGETCALVGPSGSGKSTIVNLMLRAYDPDEGVILLDGIDLRQYDPIHLRRLFGYVEQEVILWDQTLKYNVLYGSSDKERAMSEESLDAIACGAGISEFYDRLGSSRFETLIGENGFKLSGGQKQRVGIARALAKGPSILIFDEATNSLDTENDWKIQKTIRSTLQNRTGIIIAHRLSTIRHADRIITVQKGRIVGIGKHADLKVTCPEYMVLVEHEQMAHAI